MRPQLGLKSLYCYWTVSWLVAIGSVPSSVSAQSQATNGPERLAVSAVSTIPIYPILDGSQDEMIRVTLTGLRAGEIKHQSVLIQNKCGKPISLIDADVSCKCTSVKVPKRELPPEELELLEFDFSIDKVLDSLETSHVVTVHCTGAKSNLVFAFQGKVEDYVGFSRRDASRSIWKGEGNLKFGIPLLVSDGANWNGISVRCRGLNGDSGGRLVVNPSEKKVEVSLKPDLGATNSGVLVVELVRDDRPLSEFVLNLRTREQFEIVPTPLLFFRAASEKIVRSANGILRVRSANETEPASILRIFCKSDSGAVFPVDVKELRSGVYRIRVDVMNAQDMERDTLLHWELITSDGSFRLTTKSSLTN